MKNPASYLQTKLFDILNTAAITYNSVAVPVFSNDETHNDSLQIVIGEYSDSDSSNKHNFQGTGSQVIEVISIQHKTAQKKTVNDVGELVMDLIQPNPRSSLLNGDFFQVNLQGRPSINHLIEGSGSGQKIVRLILRYNFLINEKKP